MAMRILYISQYFPPEVGATQNRAFEMTRNLVDFGHSVTVITEFPNHPSGIIPHRYRGKFFERSTEQGIEVIRVWVKASPRKNFYTRMIFYLTFMFNAVLAGIFLSRGRYEVILATSPPLFTGLAGLFLSKIKKSKFVFEVRDLWPESAVQLGEISNPSAIQLSTQMEEMCYAAASRIIVVTRGIENYLLARGIKIDKIRFIPNGSNIEKFMFNPSERARYREEWGWQDQLILIYAGTIGIAQGLETLLEAAELLSEEISIRFIIVGDGPRKADLVKLAGDKLVNLKFIPEQPLDCMPGLISAADVALIPLRDVALFKGALPSKLFDALACERPVLILIDGEAREMIEKNRVGIFVPPEDPHALAEAIKALKTSPIDIQLMGKKGRQLVEQNYSRRALAHKLEEVLRELTENRAP